MRSVERGLLHRAALTGLTTASVLVTIALVVGGPFWEWLFTILVLSFPVMLIGLSVGPRDRRPATLLFLIALGLLLLASGIGIRLLSSDPDQPWLWGLPAATALMATGLGLLPLLLVGWRFALAYADEDPDRLRRDHGAAPRRDDSPERVG